MESLFGKTFNLLSTLIGYHADRNKVIVSNISNLDTAGYKPADYVFKQDLKKAMDIRVQLTRTNEKHFPNASDEITSNDFELVSSEEKVDLDTEMSNLTSNQLMYNLSVELLARKFKAIRDVLTEAK